ncbi:hypothetical protein IMG5_104900 [Ichthyophthirius multifiliis]|uniref:Uncharacterized protein n=1 Tax=Ichthyophthirius multifiliis TaxID=5932 RepID=G0QSZ7_ICHMU|nr:hypothetical protein IMG5_104900 [Ichthyophthirius multifiliis]EGR31668.1 hypothetical protein IMG5_104900 [Ichthyophthirius multifiliis]|eukprot:XP_004035154.1 hypothetical protein IMG5_104900 [Ichthyophthirius multifiliis]
MYLTSPLISWNSDSDSNYFSSSLSQEEDSEEFKYFFCQIKVRFFNIFYAYSYYNCLFVFNFFYPFFGFQDSSCTYFELFSGLFSGISSLIIFFLEIQFPYSSFSVVLV